MSDFAKIDAMTDEEIDYTDSPPTDEAFWEGAEVVFMPPKKKRITTLIDSDVLEWLKDQDGRYQTRINAILRAYMGAQTQKNQKHHRAPAA